ncbi:variant SH3 domain-containing protein [Phthorimaea operculella]|nr:variant SH3 domain-containing protein [Phthorimaea operculella]
MANPTIAVSFDQNDRSSWYFRDLSRAEATKLLLNETESGVFLVRDSKTIPGDYVLCVREDDRVSNYIINRVVSADGTTRYRIGDQLFADMPALLAFYRLHYLDTTPLVRPLPQASAACAAAPPAHPHQVLEIVVAKYDFSGKIDETPLVRPLLQASAAGPSTSSIGDRRRYIRLQREDRYKTPLVRPLPQASAACAAAPPAHPHQVLEIVVAKYDFSGKCVHCQKPAPPAHPHQVLEIVVAKYDFSGKDADDLPFRRGERLMVINRDEEQWWTARNAQGCTGSIPVNYIERLLDARGMPLPPNDALTQLGDPPSPQGQRTRTNMQRTLPALARVRQTRVPNAYDRTALKLEEGDIVKVTKMNINGQWEGELNGKVGHFPFTYVEFLDDGNTPAS